MIEEHDLFSGDNTNGLTIKDHIYKYLSNYPIIIASFIICVGAGILYTRFTTPQHLINTLIIVKSNRKGVTSQDVVDAALSGKQQVSYFNMDNEMQLMRSSTLMQRVVEKNHFNISYYHSGTLRNTDIYLDAPFRLIPQNITNNDTYLNITLNNLSTQGGMIKYGTSKKKTKSFVFKWNQPFVANGNKFILVPRGNIVNGDGNYIATWNPVRVTAAGLSSSYTVALLDKLTTIIQLTILSENLNRGQDVLNAIAKEFNLSDIEERNAYTERSIDFINDRLNVVSQQLNGVEENLENYQGQNQLINVATQSAESFTNSNNISKSLTELNVQQGVVEMISNYFNSPANNDKLVPSTLGLNDATLASLITRYNDLQLTKQREAPSIAPNSMIMRDMNNQINDVKGSVLESLNNIKKNLQLQENKMLQQNSEYKGFLSSLPRKERALQEIKRKQSITENIYLYLLQKREEAAISATSSDIINFQQIEPASPVGHVQPYPKYIKIFSALLGLLLPIGFIYLKGLFNDKILNRNDIVRKTQIPVIGDINHIERQKKPGILIKNRSITGEQFRLIRTNLSFMLKKKEKQVILITSSVGNEGKSLVSLNLAAVLATPGKKVAILDFDLRKPSIAKNLENDNSKGLCDYLTGKTNNLYDLYQVSEDIPTLHIYFSGVVPANPGDLLLSERLKQLISELKKQYDYIVIDSPPAGLVSDAFILGEYSDICMYIIRQRFTSKTQLDFINDIAASQKLNNVGLVLNDVKTGAKYSYFGSGYYGYEVSKKNNIKNKQLPSLPVSL